MKVVLHCRESLTLTSDQIIEMVGQHRLAVLKAQDPSPLLKAYVLAAEGEAYPTVIDETGPHPGIVRWSANAVRQLAKIAAQKAVRLFVGHTDGVETPDAASIAENRPGIATVVASALFHKHNRAYNVIIAHFAPEHRAQADSLDSVSMEVEYESIQTRDNGKPVSIVDRVLDLFGVALLRHGEEPAFEAARSIGVAYAQYTPERSEMDISQITFQELAAELKRRHVQVWQLFQPDDLMGKKVPLKDGSHQYIGGDKEFQRWAVEMRGEIEAEVRAEYAPKLKELEELGKAAASSKAELAKLQAVPVLHKKLAEKNDPRLTALVNANMGKFAPGEDVEKAADEFVAEWAGVLALVSGGSQTAVEPVKPTAPQGPAPVLGNPAGSQPGKRTAFGVEIDDE